MAMKMPHVEHASLDDDYLGRVALYEVKQLNDRLPEKDLAALRFLWCELDGRVGLSSNMGAQIARLQRLSARDVPREKAERAKRDRKRRAKTEKPDALAEAAQVALAHLPSHVLIDLPPEEPEPTPQPARHRVKRSRELRWNGVLVARGVTEQRIQCKAESPGILRMVQCDHDHVDGETDLVSQPMPIEEWACPANRKTSSPVNVAHATLTTMVERGQSDLVQALFAMYSNSLPMNEEWAARFGDVWPLVLNTMTVGRHAERLTRELRAVTNGRQWVTERTACHDIIDRKPGDSVAKMGAREQARTEIRAQAVELLKRASNAYRRAKSA